MTPEQLYTLRTAAGMTQSELAARLGKAASRISEWENERRAIPMAEAIAIETVCAEKQRINLTN